MVTSSGNVLVAVVKGDSRGRDALLLKLEIMVGSEECPAAAPSMTTPTQHASHQQLVLSVT